MLSVIDATQFDVINLEWVGPALRMIVLEAWFGQDEFLKFDAQLWWENLLIRRTRIFLNRYITWHTKLLRAWTKYEMGLARVFGRLKMARFKRVVVSSAAPAEKTRER